MGTDAGPFIANLYLMSLEWRFIRTHYRAMPTECMLISNTMRLIDDLTVINDRDTFNRMSDLIYDCSLQLEKVNSCNTSANVLDLAINIKHGKFDVDLYDKRDEFGFDIVGFPCTFGNVATNMCYGTFASQIVRYSRICTRYTCFVTACHKLIIKLKPRGYTMRRLKSAFLKTVNKHNIKDKYGRGNCRTLVIWIDVTKQLDG